MGKTILIVLGLVLSACAVREATSDRITIEHSAKQPLPAERQARRHCAQFGKQAVLESQTPPGPSPSFLHLQARTSTFVCVEE